MLLNIIETTMVTTKHGQEIRMERLPDTEGDKNRGWQVDEVRAYIGDTQVGYIKMANIPRERFKRYYPTIFNYLDQIAGWAGLFPLDQRNMRWQDLSDDQLKKLIKNIEFRAYRRDHSISDDEIWNHDRRFFEEWAKQIETNLAAGEYGNKFKSFIKHHVDKPVVDFIRVAKGDKSDHYTRSDEYNLGGDNPTVNYRQKGIGRALYMEGAQWLKERGMVLRASSLQQPEAAAAWQAFKRDGLTKRDKDGRTYLSV